VYSRIRLVTSNSRSLLYDNYTKQKRWKYYRNILFRLIILLFRFVVCSDNRRWTCDLSSATEKSRATYYASIPTNTSSAQALSYNTDRTIMDCGVEIILTTLLLNWVYSNTMKSRFSLFALRVRVCVYPNTIYTSCTSIKTLHAIHQSILWSFPFRLVLHFTCGKSDDGVSILNSNSLWSTDEMIKHNIMRTYSES